MDSSSSPTAAQDIHAGAGEQNAPITEDQPLHLHYNQPSKEWSEALPVGNGRLGAMIHGRTTTELLQLNEDSVWYGGPQDRTPRDAYRNLPLLRQLVRECRHAEAEELVRTAFFASPASMRHYEPLGNCYFEFGHGDTSGYRSASFTFTIPYCLWRLLETVKLPTPLTEVE
ncbi:hypothetical protein N8I77_007617 [Diaporthe amygdali]|uniref:Glycosyl hydrolase family 95 N-terminal domain-containing protein n=1 Tax=Phomopsis amygdali TaxID=1214568 RepID=A0AAD9SDM1_PHOAM|nr:hypothetical protein N8I77_007617 [Diaporthe amygdali]